MAQADENGTPTPSEERVENAAHIQLEQKVMEAAREPDASAVSVTGHAISLRLSSEMAEIKRLFDAFTKALEDWK